MSISENSSKMATKDTGKVHFQGADEDQPRRSEAKKRTSSFAKANRKGITFKKGEENDVEDKHDSFQARSVRRQSRKSISMGRPSLMQKSSMFNMGSVFLIGRMSLFGPRSALRFQPTYRLEPKLPFHKERCEKVIKQVIDRHMENKEYVAKSAPSWSKAMSEEIKSQIKLLKFDRYKIVCVVTVGQKSQQDFMSVVKVLWDADHDGFATYTYDRPDLFAVGTVFGIYMD